MKRSMQSSALLLWLSLFLPASEVLAESITFEETPDQSVLTGDSVIGRLSPTFWPEANVWNNLNPSSTLAVVGTGVEFQGNVGGMQGVDFGADFFYSLEESSEMLTLTVYSAEENSLGFGDMVYEFTDIDGNDGSFALNSVTVLEQQSNLVGAVLTIGADLQSLMVLLPDQQLLPGEMMSLVMVFNPPEETAEEGVTLPASWLLMIIGLVMVVRRGRC